MAMPLLKGMWKWHPLCSQRDKRTRNFGEHHNIYHRFLVNDDDVVNQKEKARKEEEGRDNEFNYGYLAHGIRVHCM